MKKIFYAIAAVCLALTTVSCERNLATFTYDDNPCVFFDKSTLSSEMNAQDGGIIAVKVNRLNEKGSLTVPFTFTDNSGGLFTCEESTVTFNDGETTATINVKHADLSKFKLFSKYPFKLTIQGGKYAEVADSGAPAVTVSAQKEVVKESLGEVSIQSEWMNGETITAALECAKEVKNHYYVKDIYGSGYDLEFEVNGEEVIIDENGIPVDVYPGYGDVYLYVYSASVSGKEVTISGEYYLPAIDYSFGVCTEIITLP